MKYIQLKKDRQTERHTDLQTDKASAKKQMAHQNDTVFKLIKFLAQIEERHLDRLKLICIPKDKQTDKQINRQRP